ncbi:hypothetical protein B0H65DRAFT_47110 [Neurospora tetraspora]|uniref:RING-type domain-containing protein n=1 Tax=Neurospora tetraspora TaxID=94610 RepID=A0AAE0MWG0_9PEZI|nr:hypothetical protein B0H65DRAFT_47110 [Neurospora tetraspora]
MPIIPGMPTGPEDPSHPGESPPAISIVMCIIVSILILIAIFVARRSSYRTESHEDSHRRLRKGSGGIGINALHSLPLVKYDPDLMAQDFHHDGSTSPRGLSLVRGMDMAVSDSDRGDKPSRKAWRAFYPQIRHALLGKHRGRQPCPEDADTTSLIQTCAICTDDFVRGTNVRRLPCGHFFHPPCIDPWLLNFGKTCPLCRANLRTLTNANSQSEGCVAEPPRALLARAGLIED